MIADPMAPPTPPGSAAPPQPPRLLDQLRQTARHRGHPEPTVAAFADWSRRFILFHGKRHPREMGLAEIGQFLESLAQTEKDPVRALAASRDAVDFLYREVLHRDLGPIPVTWVRPRWASGEAAPPNRPPLLDHMRHVLGLKHDAQATEDAYVN